MPLITVSSDSVVLRVRAISEGAHPANSESPRDYFFLILRLHGAHVVRALHVHFFNVLKVFIQCFLRQKAVVAIFEINVVTLQLVAGTNACPEFLIVGKRFSGVGFIRLRAIGLQRYTRYDGSHAKGKTVLEKCSFIHGLSSMILAKSARGCLRFIRRKQTAKWLLPHGLYVYCTF
jgi:hypothetical protein